MYCTVNRLLKYKFYNIAIIIILINWVILPSQQLHLKNIISSKKKGN